MNSNEKAVPTSLEQWNYNSIEDLFVTYKVPIYQFIYRYTQDEQLSIDIVQDTFIKFQRYQANYDEAKSSIKTYLFQIAYQIMINKLKSRQRMQKFLPFLYQQNEQHEISIEEKLTIQDAIKQLSEEQRAVILLTYYHDLMQKEIATILKIPVGTVKSRHHAAIAKLKQLMGGEASE